MTKKLPEKLLAIDRAIRAGQGASAAERLRKFQEKGVAREDAAIFANLAWRVGMAATGARVLNPIVRPTGRRLAEASAIETAEYAACLVKLGALDEAEALLKELPASEVPQALLYRALGLVAKWDYGPSIPILEQYLATPGLSKYQRHVGRVNLAAAFVEERMHQKVTPLVRELIYELSLERHHLLLGRTLIHAADSLIWQKKAKAADDFLRKARELLKEMGTIDFFFVEKFEAVNAFVNGGGKRELAGLHEIRKQAVVRGHWETVRDCDRTEALVSRREELLWHVYFGTPFPGYREQLLRAWGAPVAIPDSYRWTLFPEGKASHTFDLAAGGLAGSSKALKEGQALHRLLVALAGDFYQAFRMAPLHAVIHPGEHYHPLHSPAKLRQAIARLRKWFQTSRVPLQIEEAAQTYRLTSTKPLEVIVTLSRKAAGRNDALLEKLKTAVPDAPFSLKEAATVLELSERSTLRIVEEGLTAKRLVRLGARRGTRYRFS